MQIQSDSSLQIQEKAIIQDLEKWSMLEESIMKQKSRAKWITVGDSNTAYFSALVKERSHKKHIHELKSLEGDLLKDPTEIQQEIMAFYKGLMGTTSRELPSINQNGNVQRANTYSGATDQAYPTSD